jgi:hypothetical protein
MINHKNKQKKQTSQFWIGFLAIFFKLYNLKLYKMLRIKSNPFLHIILIAALFWQCKSEEKGDVKFAVDIGNSEIPYLIINTNGKSILNEPKTKANLEVYISKNLVQKQEIGIEFKGKTSFRLSEKKPFSFECYDSSGDEMKVSFLEMPASEDWILGAHIINNASNTAIDRSLMHNFIGYEMSRAIGRYAPRCKFVELEINGNYLGLYLLTEKIKRDANRVNIAQNNGTSGDDSGGYILAIDKASLGKEGINKPNSYFENNWQDDAKYTEENSFRSNYSVYGNPLSNAPFGPPYHPEKYLETYFLYEYPDRYNINANQKAYIKKYIDDFETALKNDDFSVGQRTYANYIDVSSFVDFFLLNELCMNIDAYRLSTYLFKDKAGKLHMGPIWDLDIGFAEGGRIPENEWVINYNTYVPNDAWLVTFWWQRLLQDPQFKIEVKTRWQSLRNSGKLNNTTITNLIDSTTALLNNNGAISRNYMKWDQTIGINHTEAIVTLKNFITKRANWMDQKINEF